ASRRRMVSSDAPACTVATRSAGLTETTWSSARVLMARSAGASAGSPVPWPPTRIFPPSPWPGRPTRQSPCAASARARGTPAGCGGGGGGVGVGGRPSGGAREDGRGRYRSSCSGCGTPFSTGVHGDNLTGIGLLGGIESPPHGAHCAEGFGVEHPGHVVELIG